MDSQRHESACPRECKCLPNITNHYDENVFWCAKVSENMKYHLILIPNLAKKLILHRIHLANFTENLGSNLIRDAQLLTTIGMRLLS